MGDTLLNLAHQTGFFSMTAGNVIMVAVALGLMYLAIVKQYEPLLLLPISFGMLLVNLYPPIMEEGGLLYFFFKLDEFPSAIPSSSNAVTFIVRYRPDKTQNGTYYPGIVMWGDTAGWNVGKLVKISTEKDTPASIRLTIGGQNYAPGGFYRTDMGTERSRWITMAFVCSPKIDEALRAFAAFIGIALFIRVTPMPEVRLILFLPLLPRFFRAKPGIVAGS